MTMLPGGMGSGRKDRPALSFVGSGSRVESGSRAPKQRHQELKPAGGAAPNQPALHSEGNHQPSEKATDPTGESTCKSSTSIRV